MTRAFIPGSFDPPTLGHFDIFVKCMKAFDEIVVGIGVNPDKKYMFDPHERGDMIIEHILALGYVTANLKPTEISV